MLAQRLLASWDDDAGGVIATRSSRGVTHQRRREDRAGSRPTVTAHAPQGRHTNLTAAERAREHGIDGALLNASRVNLALRTPSSLARLHNHVSNARLTARPIEDLPQRAARLAAPPGVADPGSVGTDGRVVAR